MRIVHDLTLIAIEIINNPEDDIESLTIAQHTKQQNNKEPRDAGMIKKKMDSHKWAISHLSVPGNSAEKARPFTPDIWPRASWLAARTSTPLRAHNFWSLGSILGYGTAKKTSAFSLGIGENGKTSSDIVGKHAFEQHLKCLFPVTAFTAPGDTTRQL